LAANVIILAPDPGTAERLEHALGARANVGAVVIERVDAPLSAAIARTRRENGSLPVGVAARTSIEAIEAIEAGADEAMAIDGRDRVAVLELIDRTRLRGSLRGQLERERVEVAQAEKLAALGTLVAGVAHEVNNPLSAVILGLDVLPAQIGAAADVVEEIVRAAEQNRALSRDDVVRIAALGRMTGTREDILRDVEHTREAAMTIKDVVKELRVFARTDDDEPPQVLSIPAVVDHLVRLAGREIQSMAIIERDFPANLPELLLPHSRITQVLTNLLVNATHAMRDVPRDVHRLRIGARADEQTIAISITDTGPGIPPDALERIFDPFFTTKRANMGTGLGLSISRNLIRKLGGDLVVESVYGEGATFVVLVPRATEAEIRAARIRARIVPRHPNADRRLAVLVVGDDDHLVRAYSRVLAKRYDVLLASEAQEAIEMLASGSHADVLLCDMGAMELPTLANWLVEKRPTLAARLVIVSDDPELFRRNERLLELAPEILGKPTHAATLVRAIEDAGDRQARSAIELQKRA
jgi:signal transduction histidine kinase